MSISTGTTPRDTTPGRGAQVLRVPPPTYFAAALAAGMLLREVSLPLSIGARAATVPVGAGFLALGATLAVAGVAAVVRHHTTIVPHRAVSRLLTAGIYRISRNPMYTGLAIAYLGAALLIGSWWPLVTWPLALLAVRRVVIEPEERYLAGRFGQAYLDYQARVRRWL
jgi:protein-S-isoprenylcysteine O-methyltransferase Ste14